MDKIKYKKINKLLTEIFYLWDSVNQKGVDAGVLCNNCLVLEVDIQTLLSMNYSMISYDEIIQLDYIKNNNLHGDEFHRIVGKDIPEILKSLNNIYKQENVLMKLYKTAPEKFHLIVQQDPKVLIDFLNKASSSEFNLYCENDPIIASIWEQYQAVESFKKGNIKLKDLDDYILTNHYFYSEIQKIIEKRIFEHYSSKIEMAQTMEQKMNIKLLLNKKIETTIKEIYQRRELALNQEYEAVKEDVLKYEI